MNPFIDTIKAIEVESPVDKIIRQLKQLIVSGQLKPGDRLPAERSLAEKFGVGRSYVREAILKLEFYGLLRTSPQSGTYVSGLSINILDNLLTDVINFNKDDFNALIEARYYLELTAVRVAAERRTTEDLLSMGQALDEYETKVNKGLNGVEEDLLFHIKIARSTKNPVIESMMLILVPDLIKSINENKVCGEERGILSIPEHRAILKALEEGDSVAAENAMAIHLDEIFQISRAGYGAKQLLKEHKNE
ncbi:FadR/GntR family transcriptional regulator [Arcticibacter sp. MXS-1]|uniref:FadR/GntR family transcriptional regulator n=1 Tax=Arcticibacter sp. MXS-1 TaxID=3341726 RepID=UPI0035A82B6A